MGTCIQASFHLSPVSPRSPCRERQIYAHLFFAFFPQAVTQFQTRGFEWCFGLHFAFLLLALLSHVRQLLALSLDYSEDQINLLAAVDE